MTFAELQVLAEIAPSYMDLRKAHPLIPARKIYHFVRGGSGERFEEFMCPGHVWRYTGSAYGGDDDSHRGEGRVYCANCGADGDA